MWDVRFKLTSSKYRQLTLIGTGLLCLVVSLFLAPLAPTRALQSCDQVCNKDDQEQYLRCNRDKQACLESNIRETQSQAITLNNTISILNGKIRVQEIQIESTRAEIETLERQIVDLTNRIAGLDLSLDRLTTVLVGRVNEHYKAGRLNPMLALVLSDSFADIITNYKYLQVTQEQTADAMQRAESQKITYDEQKALKETKQAEVEQKQRELEQQQTELTKQRSDQQFLLQRTKNDEAKYQAELAKTLAELEAIQSIIAGRGQESAAGDINQGDSIASIIVGASPCSNGTHLHFEVVKDGTHRDPAGYLKSIDALWNNGDGSFGFGGDWDWPVNNPAKINQGYGMTQFARAGYYRGAPHTGIDMASKDNGNYTVKAVKAGKLFRGSIKCGSGLLRYVKVEHKDDSSLNTYYLHVNY